MTDIFFSYSSKDRDRVRPIHDALVAQGFQVFWDQKVPAGQNWDNWIRRHLTQSKCAIVFWSATSVGSDNVRHEAVVAKQQGKLVSVLLEDLSAEQFPMGLYAQQAANLSRWDGDLGYEEWVKLRRDFEAKLTPAWMRRQIDEIEAELVGERARREGAEHRDSVLQAQIAKEAKTQQELKRERNEAREEVATLKATVEELTRARSEAEARETDTLQQVAALKVTVDDVTRARTDAEQRLTKLRQTKAKEIVRSISPFVIAAALATLGIWAYQLIWPAPQPVPAVISVSTSDLEGKLNAAEVEQQRLKEEVQRQAKVVAEAQTKQHAAEAEQQRLKDEAQRQTKAAAEVEAKLQLAQAEQQRQAKAASEAQTKLQTELQIQAKAAKDADTKRQDAEKAAAEADTKRKEAEQRLAAAKASDERKPTTSPAQQAATVPLAGNAEFEIRRNMRAKSAADVLDLAESIDDCQKRCIGSAKCQIFSFSKSSNWCYLYSDAEFEPNPGYDSGVRRSAVPTTMYNKGPFEIRTNTEAKGSSWAVSSPASWDAANSMGECEERCTRLSQCKVFTFNKRVKSCYLYSSTSGLSSKEGYDTGIRR